MMSLNTSSHIIQIDDVKIFILEFFKISLCLFLGDFKSFFLGQSNKFFWSFTL